MHHLEDLRSDFSAIHRVDDVEAMPGPRFFALAHRISAYRGVMARRMEEQVAMTEPVAPSVPAPSDRTVVDAAPAAVAADPGLRGLISFGVSGG